VRWWALAGLLCLLAGCSGDNRPAGEPATAEAPPVDGHLFTRLPSSYTGVRFENRLTESQDFNVFTYRNFYNGGGVALGDLNGDGLPEVVLTSNMGDSRIYRLRDNIISQLTFDHSLVWEMMAAGQIPHSSTLTSVSRAIVARTSSCAILRLS